MLCPKCKSKTRVTDCRLSKESFRRRRKCKVCCYKFTTYEKLKSHINIEKNINRLKKIGEIIKIIVTEYEEDGASVGKQD